MPKEEKRRQTPGGRRSSPQEETRGNAAARRRRKRRGPSGTLLYVLFIIGVSALLAGVGWVAANDVLALNKPAHTAIITIEEGERLGDIVDELEEAGIINYKSFFRLFSLMTGAKDTITPGTFELNTEMDYRAIITNLGSNSPSRQQVSVTIPEGYTVAQVFQLLEDKGVSTVEKLNEKAANHNYNFSFLQEIPLGEPTRLEGYLFPDTYIFYMGQDPLYVINKMLLGFDTRLTDELRQEVLDSGRSIYEVLTVASLIEKETDGTDQGRIASVIYNRLNNPSAETAGYLNIDAAIYYVTGRTVTQADYGSVDSPYNTYRHKGLPPGPIANPGMVAIRAAMYPESTGYYYYALNPGTGRHEFAKTYAEHQQVLASFKSGT